MAIDITEGSRNYRFQQSALDSQIEWKNQKNQMQPIQENPADEDQEEEVANRDGTGNWGGKYQSVDQYQAN